MLIDTDKDKMMIGRGITVYPMFDIPEDMDIPELRKIKKLGNAHWLMRNMVVRNRNHPKFIQTIAKIKEYISRC